MSTPLDLTLIRYAYLPQATLGRLLIPGVPYALYTLERPWIQNPAGLGGMPAKSCVPDGVYELRAHDSAKFPGTYQLVNEVLGVYADTLPAGQAWGRSAILIHKANQVDDVIGCIGVGAATVIYNDNPTILRSGDALEVVRARVGREVVSSIWIRPIHGTEEPMLPKPPAGTPQRPLISA